jgi:hypothetical protein
MIIRILGLEFSPFSHQMLIRRIKHELIIKLIAEAVANLRDESSKPN